MEFSNRELLTDVSGNVAVAPGSPVADLRVADEEKNFAGIVAS
jgi:hypothetical protein